MAGKITRLFIDWEQATSQRSLHSGPSSHEELRVMAATTTRLDSISLRVSTIEREWPRPSREALPVQIAAPRAARWTEVCGCATCAGRQSALLGRVHFSFQAFSEGGLLVYDQSRSHPS